MPPLSTPASTSASSTMPSSTSSTNTTGGLFQMDWSQYHNCTIRNSISEIIKNKLETKEFSVFDLSRDDALLYYRSVEETYISISERPVCGLCGCSFTMFEYTPHLEKCIKFRKLLIDDVNLEPPKKQVRIDLTSPTEHTEICFVSSDKHTPQQPMKHSVYSHEIHVKCEDDDIIIPICHPSHYADKKLFATIKDEIDGRGIDPKIPNEVASKNDKCSGGVICVSGTDNSCVTVNKEALSIWSTPLESNRSKKKSGQFASFCSFNCLQSVLSKMTSESSYNKFTSAASSSGLLYYTKDILKRKKSDSTQSTQQ
jgi:hypothetical protein